MAITESGVEQAREYAVVFEPTESGWSAFIPDLALCFATGSTFDEVRERIDGAARWHVEGRRRHRLPMPAAKTRAGIVLVGVSD